MLSYSSGRGCTDQASPSPRGGYALTCRQLLTSWTTSVATTICVPSPLSYAPTSPASPKQPSTVVAVPDGQPYLLQAASLLTLSIGLARTALSKPPNLNPSLSLSIPTIYSISSSAWKPLAITLAPSTSKSALHAP